MARFSLHEPDKDHAADAVTLVSRPDAYEFYIDATPGYTSAQLADILRQARKLGLDEIDPDEDAPEILDDGTIRIWLSPADTMAAPDNPLSTAIAVP